MKRHVSILNMNSTRGVLLKAFYDHREEWFSYDEAYELASEYDGYNAQQSTTTSSLVALSSVHKALERREADEADRNSAEYRITERGMKIIEIQGVLDVGKAIDIMH